MFIDFEGIDGSGKTTLSNQLAARLRRLGYRVTHAREGGELKSQVARRVRELTRDARLLEMTPRAEFFLNLARDAQQVEEVIKPALARGDICIADRYVYSQLALSAGGRGVPADALEPAAAIAAQDIWPDLVILVDVEPTLARLRKRLGKILARREDEADSRKGLAGFGLSVRTREWFLEMARRDPARWQVVDNTHRSLGALLEEIAGLSLERLGAPAPPTARAPKAANRRRPPARRPAVRTESLEEAFFTALDEVEAREPALGIFLLTGIPGLAAHQRRLYFLERFPALTARSLSGLEDEESFQLREILKSVAPVEVVQSLTSNPSPAAMALRRELFGHAAAPVLGGLKGNDGEEAWALRHQALKEGALEAVLVGLAGVDSPRAWEARGEGLARGLVAATAKSLTGLTCAEAERVRQALFASDRLAVLRSTAGTDTPLAQRIREELFERAPKAVLRSLTGVAAEYAFALRERGAPRTKEALDSLDGMAQARAWELRERFAFTWPATALSSMRQLAGTSRGDALLARVLENFGDRIAVLRNAYAVTAQSSEARRGRAGRSGLQPGGAASATERAR